MFDGMCSRSNFTHVLKMAKSIHSKVSLLKVTVPELYRDLQLQKFNKDVIAAIIFMLLSS